MKRSYSIYEAKAKLSQIIREVRERQQSVTISYHGQPVVEIRPIEADPVDEERLAKRIRDLESRGELTRGDGERVRLQPIAKRPGALERFLEERD